MELKVLQVEVVYLRPRAPEIVALSVEAGTTLGEAIRRSGLVERCRIDLGTCAVGVFGKIRGLAEAVSAGDRIEIYRALKMDPKDRRRLISSSG